MNNLLKSITIDEFKDQLEVLLQDYTPQEIACELINKRNYMLLSWLIPRYYKRMNMEILMECILDARSGNSVMKMDCIILLMEFHGSSDKTTLNNMALDYRMKMMDIKYE